MSTVGEIESAIQSLPLDKLAELRTWFIEFDHARWDEQIFQDSGAGKFNSHVQEALNDVCKG